MMRKSALALAVCGAMLIQPLSAPALAADAHAPASTPILLAQAQSTPQPQAQPSPQQRAAMLKEWLQASQTQMRAYQWIEATVVSKDGEQKSSAQKRCYYGADGQVQKITLNQSSAPDGGPPGILPLGMLVKKAKEEKKEEAKEYMQNAEALVHSYIPPNPGLIQQAINGGNLGMQMLDPGRRVRLNFSNYLKPGDSMSFDIELPTNRLLAVAVNSYLNSSDDPVTLNVTMGVLQDGTMYAAQTVLNAVSKGIIVNVTNSGYQRIAP